MTARKNHAAEPPRPDRPLIGLTLGEPAGIGPEVIVKALADPALRKRARFIIYGLHELIAYCADLAEIGPYWYRVPHEEVERVESGVVVADFDEYATLGPGVTRPTAEGGHASMRFCEEAIAHLRGGRLSALVTGPISKTSWRMAGYHFPGHTELLAKRFGARRVSMMFVGGGLRVALASAHVALFDLRNSFTIGRVHQPIDLLNEALRDWFGVESPRIGVAALNPHAGEGGQFGDEEQRIIEPAVAMAREAGIRADGPIPADTLFRRAMGGEFDGIVAMYHDQALIPVKLLAFHEAVNLTLGLPAVRTSPDHGTAFDIVGKNKADCGSMKAAVSLAIDLALRRAAAGASASAAPSPADAIIRHFG